jgi:hypothetical protein
LEESKENELDLEIEKEESFWEAYCGAFKKEMLE